MTNEITRPAPRPGISDIDAYVPGKSTSKGSGKTYKLSSNETPLGPSPRAVAAYRAAAVGLEFYPDGAATKLRNAIAHRFGLDANRIVCGNGSDDLLHLLAGAYVGPGDEGIFTEHGFLVYKIAILAAGGKPVVAPEKNYTANVDEILARLTDRTRIVFIANPNNPTGTYLPFEEVKRLHKALPPRALLVLDAAYAEYVRANDYSAGLEMAATYENVVMTRTFSKIHGLAGLRIGWAYGPAHVCDSLNRIRGPFNLNSAALEAGVASLEDAAHIEFAAAHNGKWLDWLTREISALGLAVTPSVANFIMITFPKTPGQTAADAADFLSRRGLVLREIASYGLPASLRLTVGTEEANLLVVEALKAFLAQFRGAEILSAMAEILGPKLEKPIFQKLTIIGMGLIGSSIARGAKLQNIATTVIAADASQAVRQRVKGLGIVDLVTTTIKDAVADSDLVILCIPVGANGEVAREMAPHLKSGAIVSDVGSVKTSVVEAVRPHLPKGVGFVPAHPVAGTEYSGPDAGFAELFVNRWCILTPPEGEKQADVESVRRLWQALGSNVETMNCEHHDLVLAITSHVPHLIAYNIVGTAAHLEEVTQSEVIKFSAGGFRDFTRIAASDPTMWRDIFLHNKKAVLEMLSRFNHDLVAAQRMVENGDGDGLFELFTRTRAIRRGIIASGQETAAPDFGRRAAPDAKS